MSSHTSFVSTTSLGVSLRAHPIRGELHIQRHATERVLESLGNKFLVLFFHFYFLVFLDVFRCAESENDVSFFVVSAVFL